jgi:hypothetical protein
MSFLAIVLSGKSRMVNHETLAILGIRHRTETNEDNNNTTGKTKTMRNMDPSNRMGETWIPPIEWVKHGSLQ